MKSTGVVRKIDELGRFVLPIELRKNLGINNRDAVEIFVEDDKIILKKYEPSCIFCGNMFRAVSGQSCSPARPRGAFARAGTWRASTG